MDNIGDMIQNPVADMIVHLLGNRFNECSAHLAQYAVRLPKHPFGVPLRDRLVETPETVLIYHPGASRGSVEAMTRVLRWKAKAYDLDAEYRPHLRIIKLRAPGCPEDRPQHDLYFEVSDGCFDYLCSGCNDHSGTGSHYGRELTALFRSYALAFNLPLEEVVRDPREGIMTDDELIALYEELKPEMAYTPPAHRGPLQRKLRRFVRKMRDAVNLQFA